MPGLAVVGTTMGLMEFGEHLEAQIIDGQRIGHRHSSARFVVELEPTIRNDLDVLSSSRDAVAKASVDASLGGCQCGERQALLHGPGEGIRHEGAKQPAAAVAGAHGHVGDEGGWFEMTVSGVDGAGVRGHRGDRETRELRIGVRLPNRPQPFTLDTGGVVLELGVGWLCQVETQCHGAYHIVDLVTAGTVAGDELQAVGVGDLNG